MSYNLIFHFLSETNVNKVNDDKIKNKQTKKISIKINNYIKLE